MTTTPSDARPLLPAGLPHLAVVLLWYPLFTQPFIYREVEQLRRRLPLKVYTLYGRNLRCCSGEMLSTAESDDGICRLGLRALPLLVRELLRQLCTHPLRLARIFRESLFRRWTSWEALGENCWAFFAGLHLARRFREEGMDMVYAPWPRGTATAARVAARLAGIPYAMSVRGDNLEPADPDLAAKLDDALFVRVNNAADRERAEQFGRQEARGKTHLVYNSLTLPADKSCPVRLETPIRLLALGRFDVTKGFDILLRACALLKARKLPFTLTLAGSGGHLMGLGKEDKLIAELRTELGLENCVQLPGLVTHNELPNLLMAHDIFVAPCVVHGSGRRDGIPNTVIEALSYGMPVISTTINALPEVVRHEQTGLAVPPGDPEALADAVQRLADHPDEARRLGEQGRRLAREMFDPETNSRMLAELFAAQYAQWKATCAA